MIAPLESNVMARLRAETHTEHKLAEGSEFESALVSGRVTRPLYIAYLQQRMQIHAALDPAVMELVETEPRLGGLVVPELLQRENLAADLDFFEASAGTPVRPAREYADEIRSLGQRRCVSLLGIYYVFEGSKNGARYIAKAVQRALGLIPPDGLRYLDPHGEAQRGLWTAFKDRMNAVGFAGVEQDLMVGGAKRAFEAVRAVDGAIWEAFNVHLEAGK
ncbi:MAG: hypothetical protein AMXMBFR47_28990 [Planctomycetota bacterium]